MGNSPKNSKTPTKRTQTRVVSFDDARRASKRPLPRKTGGKSIRIARGEIREGALQMMTEEEIEARAAAEKKQAKLAKKQRKKNEATPEKKQAKPAKKRQNDNEAAPDKKPKAKKSRILEFADARKKQAEEKKRAKNKAKADRQFNAAYAEDNKAAAAKAAEAGPRAAVYKGEMGSSQKKSSKMQKGGAGAVLKGLGSKVSVPNFKLPEFTRKLGRGFLGVAIVALFAVMLYGPAQQYYLQMRETDRLQAEFIAVSERSNVLQSTIDTLSSEEGIEDKAHTDLGYVKKNEQTASVRGLNLVDNTEFSSNVAPGSVPAPDTWYSAFLDPLFGYSH